MVNDIQEQNYLVLEQNYPENTAKKRKIDLQYNQLHGVCGSDDVLMDDISDSTTLPRIEFNEIDVNDVPRKDRQCTCCVSCEELTNESEKKIYKYEKQIEQMKSELKKIRNKAHYFQTKCRLADAKIQKQNETRGQILEKIEVIRLNIFF